MPQTIAERLAEPFDPRRVKWLPQVVKDNRAMAVAYLDARAIVGRLDSVLGIGGWQEHYVYLSNGCVCCELSCLIDGVWITKSDAGGPSKQPDVSNQCKAAFSNSLKRAAAKFGVGRYLWFLPSQWVDYDPAKKQFTRTPVLPDWALPAKPVNGSQPCQPTKAASSAVPSASTSSALAARP